MTRTIVIGKADEKQKELYNLVLRANLEAEAALHAGLRGCDVDKPRNLAKSVTVE